MGSYGIGIGRTMAAIVEQNHDDKGIIWPENIAPYKAIVLLMNSKDEKQAELAENVYETLQEYGIEVILDDRDERPGVKFNDAELIGIPYRITVGKKAADGIMEFKARNSNEILDLTLEEIIDRLK
jgi:prolyl-tRNA synthetase